MVAPKVIASDYVTNDWQFAYLAANKCANPNPTATEQLEHPLERATIREYHDRFANHRGVADAPWPICGRSFLA